MVDTKHVAALLDALCERPLGDGRDAPSDELQALCRAALAKVGDVAGNEAGAGPDASADAERLTAALAALWSGADQETARRTVEAALTGSPAARLDAEAARAFLDTIEQSLQTAPAHLVDQVTAGAGRVAAPGTAHRRPPVPATGSWSLRRWGVAASCAVLLVAGVSSWSIYLPKTEPPAELAPAQPAATESRSMTPAAPVNAAVPASPPALAPAPPPAPALEPAPAQSPALATAEPCAPRRPTGSGVDTARLQQGRTAGEAEMRTAEKQKREALPADAVDCAAASGQGTGREALRARAKASAGAARAPAAAAPAASQAAPAKPAQPPSPPVGVR